VLAGVLACGWAFAAPSPDTGSPVVIELFTSQGCSSCPPADEILSRLGKDDKTGPRVIPLAFHVDYWNRIGWTDPFSALQWTDRQEAYGRRFEDRMYTPQLVVNGRVQLNGAQAPRVLAEIKSQLARRAAGATISLGVKPTAGARAALAIEVAAELKERIEAGKLDAVVAVFESDLVTPVERGENRGKTLRNDYVVRDLRTAFALEPKAGARASRSLEIKLRREWKLEHLGVAAFLQDRGSMVIHAAAVAEKAKAPN
jgi:hypothetical protein